MKKIFYYLLLIVLAGGSVASFWVYQRYFKVETPKFLTFTVMKGDIQDVVKVRGEVVPQKDFDLEFPFSGIIEKIFVKDGQLVNQNDPLIKLETIDFELEIQKLQDQLNQAKASLVIKQAEARNIKTNLNTITQKQDTMVENAYRTLLSDGLVAEPRDDYNYNVTPPLVTGRYNGPEGAYEFRVDKKQITDNDYIMYAFGLEQTGRVEVKKTGPTALGTRGLFVDFPDGVEAYFDITWSVTIPNTKSSIYVTNFNVYQQVLRERDRAIEEAQAEIINQVNNVSIAEAKIFQAEAEIKNYQTQITIIQEKIKKSTLYAPANAKVAKVWLEKQELAKPGQIAITLETYGHKIQTDISELEIGKIREDNGNEVSVRFDAFPERTLGGKIVSVDAKEIIKEGDKYYRANIYLDSHGTDIRSGMNADLVILISSKENVLKIPEFAVYKKDGNTFVMVLEDDKQKEASIETGISDGESIEVIKGLREGQTVTMLAD